MKKLMNLILIVLVVIAALSVILWMVQGGGERGVQLMLTVAYVYLALAALLAIVMTVMNLGKSQSKSRLGLYVFGAVVVLAVLFYFAVAKSSPVTLADGSVVTNPFTLKITDTMLFLAYAALGVTALVMIGGEVRKAFK